MQEQDNQFQIIEPASQIIPAIPKVLEGRECGLCGKIKAWEHFHLKPNGLNGRDSRCKPCILRLRKEKKRQARLKKRLLSFAKIQTTVVGTMDEDIINEFSYIFAQGISGLLEKGHLK